MTKADLIKKIATAANINATEAKQALDAATESIKQALAAGEKVQLLGFGTFSDSQGVAFICKLLLRAIDFHRKTDEKRVNICQIHY